MEHVHNVLCFHKAYADVNEVDRGRIKDISKYGVNLSMLREDVFAVNSKCSFFVPK